MICTCVQCGSPFWRYNRAHPPAGVCSLPCHDSCLAGEKPASPPPATPATALLHIYAHRRAEHGGAPILVEFEDCEECERLEASYADSLNWHYAAITRDIHEAHVERFGGRARQTLIELDEPAGGSA